MTTKPDCCARAEAVGGDCLDHEMGVGEDAVTTNWHEAASEVERQLSQNARETLEQVGMTAQEIAEDLAQVDAGGQIAEQELLAECLDGAEGAAVAGWREYVKAVGVTVMHGPVR